MLREARYKPEKPDEIPIHSQSLILPGLYAIARGTGHLETCQTDDNDLIRITLNHDKDDIKNENNQKNRMTSQMMTTKKRYA